MFETGDRVVSKTLGLFGGKVRHRELRNGEPWLCIVRTRAVEVEEWVKETDCCAICTKVNQQPEAEGQSDRAAEGGTSQGV